MMLLAFAFAALVWSGRIQPWHILVLAALGGVAMASSTVAQVSSVRWLGFPARAS